MRADWKKTSEARASHKRLKEFYPIGGLVEGWYFRIHEDATGSYVVEGRDIDGRTVSRRTTGNPEKTLAEYVEHARSTTGSKKG